MPYSETILTEMVENIEHDFCCHSYLSRKDDVTWIAVTEKILDDDGIWIGAMMRVCSNIRLRILLTDLSSDNYFLYLKS